MPLPLDLAAEVVRLRMLHNPLYLSEVTGPPRDRAYLWAWLDQWALAAPGTAVSESILSQIVERTRDAFPLAVEIEARTLLHQARNAPRGPENPKSIYFRIDQGELRWVPPGEPGSTRIRMSFVLDAVRDCPPGTKVQWIATDDPWKPIIVESKGRQALIMSLRASAS